jgi:hypothetical protein
MPPSRARSGGHQIQTDHGANPDEETTAISIGAPAPRTRMSPRTGPRGRFCVFTITRTSALVLGPTEAVALARLSQEAPDDGCIELEAAPPPTLRMSRTARSE